MPNPTSISNDAERLKAQEARKKQFFNECKIRGEDPEYAKKIADTSLPKDNKLEW